MRVLGPWRTQNGAPLTVSYTIADTEQFVLLLKWPRLPDFTSQYELLTSNNEKRIQFGITAEHMRLCVHKMYGVCAIYARHTTLDARFYALDGRFLSRETCEIEHENSYTSWRDWMESNGWLDNQKARRSTYNDDWAVLTGREVWNTLPLLIGPRRAAPYRDKKVLTKHLCLVRRPYEVQLLKLPANPINLVMAQDGMSVMANSRDRAFIVDLD